MFGSEICSTWYDIFLSVNSKSYHRFYYVDVLDFFSQCLSGESCKSLCLSVQSQSVSVTRIMGFYMDGPIALLKAL